MKTFLTILVVLLAAYAFGPELFSGEFRIHGARNPEPQTAVQAPEPEPVAPAVFLPGSESPIFPEPRTRVRTPKAQKTPAPARDGASGCLGPVCYYEVGRVPGR